MTAMLIQPAKNEHPIRILIADDEPRILDEYLHVLGNAREPDLHQRALIDLETELFGGNDVGGDRVTYDLCCCRQADEAIASVEKSIRDGRPFAIAFLDVRMPPAPTASTPLSASGSSTRRSILSSSPGTRTRRWSISRRECRLPTSFSTCRSLFNRAN